MPAEPRPGAFRWTTMLILYGALALHNGLRMGPVPLVEELRARYAVEYAGIGNVIGAYTLTYAVAQLAAGLLTDRFGPKRLLNTGGQLASALGGPLYGAMLDRGLAFEAVWGTAAALGVLRIGAVLLLREPRRPRI